jgi:hypothetical protein
MFKLGTPEENKQEAYKDPEGGIPSSNSGCGGIGRPRPWVVVSGRGATLCIWWERALAGRQCICELVWGGTHLAIQSLHFRRWGLGLGAKYSPWSRGLEHGIGNHLLFPFPFGIT